VASVLVKGNKLFSFFIIRYYTGIGVAKIKT